MKIIFVKFVLASMFATLAQMQGNINNPATAKPITLEQIQGLQSDIRIMSNQDIFGLGEPIIPTEQISPLLVINPVNPDGVVIPTSTQEKAANDPIVIFTKPNFSICPEYPAGGAPANVKCGN